MAKQSKSCSFIVWTIVPFLTILSSVRHTYVTALTSPTNNSDDAIRLLHDIIDTFDNRVRPILNQSKPIEVFLTYNLVNLIEIDELNQKITLNVWVNFSWWDEFRTWDPNDYGGNDVIHPSPTDIWRPKTVLTNSADERDVFKNADTPLSIYSSGATRWYIGGVYFFVCAMDLTYFPYDQQVCMARVMSTNLGTEITFLPTIPTIVAQDYITNGEWDLVSSRVESGRSALSADEQLGFLRVSVTFKRRPMYYLINVLVPTMCLSVLSLFGFVLPKDSGERASFAITVLLALAVYMGTVSSQLPANSDTFPLFSVYIFCLLVLSMLSVFIIVCQLRMIGSCCSDDSKKSESDREKSQNEDYWKTIMANFNGQKSEAGSNIRHICTSKVSPQNNNINVNEDRRASIDNTDDKNAAIHDTYMNDNSKTDKKSYWDKHPEMQNNQSVWKSLKCLIVEYDDAILMVIFSIIWIIFTIIFVAMISQHP